MGRFYNAMNTAFILTVFALCLLGIAGLALGQSLTTISSGTITTGGTFQLVFTGNCPNGVTDNTGCAGGAHNRSGCTIVNNAATNMFVWPNPVTASLVPTDAKSATIPPNGSFNCQLYNGKVIQDPIYIDGTTAGAFFAAQQ